MVLDRGGNLGDLVPEDSVVGPIPEEEDFRIYVGVPTEKCGFTKEPSNVNI